MILIKCVLRVKGKDRITKPKKVKGHLEDI